MRDSLRDVVRAQRLRRALRTKLQRAIQEVVGPPYAEQMRELASLRQEMSELRGRLIESSSSPRNHKTIEQLDKQQHAAPLET
jgi:hypothetical protein